MTSVEVGAASTLVCGLHLVFVVIVRGLGVVSCISDGHERVEVGRAIFVLGSREHPGEFFSFDTGPNLVSTTVNNRIVVVVCVKDAIVTLDVRKKVDPDPSGEPVVDESFTHSLILLRATVVETQELGVVNFDGSVRLCGVFCRAALSLLKSDVLVTPNLIPHAEVAITVKVFHKFWPWA